MIATIENMSEKFREYNKLYFNNSLPLPKFEIMHTYKESGYFMFQKEKGKSRIKYKKIFMTDYFDFTEEMYRNILVHEMIHYYIAFNHIEDDDAHGKEFTKIANELNTKYGLKITDTINASSFKITEKAPKISLFFRKLFG